jgi:hypothetical protein
LLRFNVQGKLPLQKYTLVRWILLFRRIKSVILAPIAFLLDFFYPLACKAALLIYLCGRSQRVGNIGGCLV